MIGTILIATIGYGLAASLLVFGVLCVVAAFKTTDGSALISGFLLAIAGFGAAVLTRWVVGL